MKREKPAIEIDQIFVLRNLLIKIYFAACRNSTEEGKYSLLGLN
jgi:hypothetical protein